MEEDLTKNQEKVYAIIKKYKSVSQPQIFKEFDDDYSSNNSKRVVLTNTLMELKNKKMINIIDKNNKDSNRIPVNIWSVIR